MRPINCSKENVADTLHLIHQSCILESITTIMSISQQNTSQNYAQHGGIGSPAEVAVVMLPFPDHGHLNQLLYLSRLISSYNIPVHFVSTATHIRQVALRVHGWDPLMDPSIHFHEIRIPPPPKPGAKSPASKLSSFDALVSIVHLHREPFSELLRKLSSVTKRVVVIHDHTMFLVVKDVLTNFPIIAKPDIYGFEASSAFCSYAIRQGVIGEHVLIDGEPAKNFPSIESCWPIMGNKYKNFFIDSHTFNHRNVMNTCRVIEGQYIDFLSKDIDANELDGANEKWALGPFNPLQIIANKDCTNRHGCLEWLDKQPPKSVIYVSFGTTKLLSDEQINEIAIGLETSGHSFIWVVREAEGEENQVGEHGKDGILPKGYEDRVRGRGIIVRDWAPQLEILSHSSTGGFLSHCGWNSCMESISMGVPIAAWPMQSDQPMNAVLITQVLKVGLVVRDWEHRDKLVKSDTIRNAVKSLMDSDEGDELRQRAKELSNAVKGSIVKEGGIATEEMDAFIAHITR